MRPRLLLHAGTHKTGTSTIQRTLAENRIVLADHGIQYPDCRPWFGSGSGRAHHSFAHALAHPDREVRAVAHNFARSLTKSPARLTVLSSEALYRHLSGPVPDREAWEGDAYWARRLEYLGTVADALDGFDVEVLLLLRRPDSFAESLYRGQVTTGVTSETFVEWRRQKAALFDYAAQIDTFERAFGRVQVVNYESATAVGLLDVFFDRIGAPPPRAQAWERRSVDARVVLWFLRTEERPSRREGLAFAQSVEATELFDDAVGPSLWSSTDERDEFLSSFAGEFGTEFFEAPREGVIPAELSAEDADRIGAAWSDWKHRGSDARTTT